MRRKSLAEHVLDDTFLSRNHHSRLGIEELSERPPIDETKPLINDLWARLRELIFAYRECRFERQRRAVAVEFEQTVRRLNAVERSAANIFEIVTKRIGPHPLELAPDCAPDAGAKRFVKFARTYLRQTKGRWAGEPLKFERWQVERMVKPAYIVDPATGLRLRNEVYWQLAKKNGKSTLAACAMLYALCADNEHGAQVYAAATDRDQARLIFNQAVEWVEHSELRPHLRILKDVIEAPSVNGVFRVLSADAISDEGIDLHAGVIDEYAHHVVPDLYDLFSRSGSARMQPLVVVLSNAGEDVQASPCGELYQQCKAVEAGADGAREDIAVYIPEVPDELAGDVKAIKRHANPASWITAEHLEKRARAERPVDFLRYRCNRWTRGDYAWLPTGAWDACKGEVLLGDADAPAALAVDYGAARDTAAIVAAAVIDGKVHVRAHVLGVRRVGEPSPAAHVYLEDKIPLEALEEALRDHIFEYQVVDLAYDPWQCRRSAELICTETGVGDHEFQQTNELMCPASQRLHELITHGRLVHDGDPVLAAHVGNAITKETPRGWRLERYTRPTQGRGRGQRKSRPRPMDAAVAMAMAADVASDGGGVSVYEERDLLVLGAD